MKNLLILLCSVCLSVSLTAQLISQPVLFTDGWKFHKGNVDQGEQANFDDGTWRSVDLPHDWSIEGPFSQEWASGTGYLPGGIGWYRKTFNLDKLGANEKAFIYFDGVYMNSEVWLNGQYLGKRPNGYTPFMYEITPHLKKDKNLMAVKVDHSKFADSRWYPGSGIYRNVYLIIKKPVYIPVWGISFTTPEVSQQNALAMVRVSVQNSLPAPARTTVESKLSLGSKVVATSKKEITITANEVQEASMSLRVGQPKLWSVEQPQLYTLTVTTYQDGKKTDEQRQQVGFRTIRFDANKGFFLNSKNMKLKGVCIHHDAGALGAAVPREVWLRRLLKLKEIGCNSIRMSHYPHQDYIYDLCDELGFLVIDEAFDEWEVGKNKWIAGWNVGKPGNDGYHEHFQEWADRDLRDMILRSRNHPSIIMWSIGNEIDYPNDPYTHEILNTGRNPQIFGKGHLPDHPPASRLAEISKRLVEIVRQVDTTRPVTAALAGVVMSNTTTYPEDLDVVGYNYQEYRYAEDHKKYPQRIIYGSENGKSLDAWTAVDTSQNIFGQFLWTAFDFMGEARTWPVRSSGAGLMDLAGNPKTDYFMRQTLWLQKPVLHLVASKVSDTTAGRGRRNSKPSWNWAKGDKLSVNCISNAEEAELFINGKSMGRKYRKDTATRGLTWSVDYEAGELSVKGFTGGREVGSLKLKTTDSAAKITAVSDKKVFRGGRKELAHIEMQISDKDGALVYDAANEVTVDIEGPAILLGLESGNLSSHEDYKSNKRKAYNGKILAYVQSKGQPGEVKITLHSPGLKSTSIIIGSGK